MPSSRIVVRFAMPTRQNLRRAILTLMFFRWQGNYGHDRSIANGATCSSSSLCIYLRLDFLTALRNVPSTVILVPRAVSRVHEEPP